MFGKKGNSDSLQKFGLNFNALSSAELAAHNRESMTSAASDAEKFRLDQRPSSGDQLARSVGSINSAQNWIIIRQNEQIIRQNEQIIQLLQSADSSETVAPSAAEDIHNQDSTNASNDDSRFFS